MGIEPTSLQSQYNILPLNYYHLYIIRRERLELSTFYTQNKRSTN